MSLTKSAMPTMIQPIFCHLLIGLPGSGKSTFAQELNQQIPHSVIISTDNLRLKLFGNEAIQGDWNIIEQEVIKQVKLAVAQEQSVIYDATNVKVAWRSSFLAQVQGINAEWIAWWIKTPIDICKAWNQKRSRQVPDQIIDVYAEYLEQSIPGMEEGFMAVKEIKFARQSKRDYGT